MKILQNQGLHSCLLRTVNISRQVNSANKLSICHQWGHCLSRTVFYQRHHLWAWNEPRILNTDHVSRVLLQGALATRALKWLSKTDTLVSEGGEHLFVLLPLPVPHLSLANATKMRPGEMVQSLKFLRWNHEDTSSNPRDPHWKAGHGDTLL